MFSGGAIIFGLFAVAYVFVIVYGLYSRAGSGINQRPYGKRYGGAPGAMRASCLDHDHDVSWLRSRPRGRSRPGRRPRL